MMAEARKSYPTEALQGDITKLKMNDDGEHPLQRAKSAKVQPGTALRFKAHRRGSGSDGDMANMVAPAEIMPISENTRRLIESMDANQIKSARAQFERVKLKRRESKLMIMKRASIRKSKRFDENDDEEEAEKEVMEDLIIQREDLKNILDGDSDDGTKYGKTEKECSADLERNETSADEPPSRSRVPRQRRLGLTRSVVEAEKNDLQRNLKPSMFDTNSDGDQSSDAKTDKTNSSNRRTSRRSAAERVGVGGGLFSKITQGIHSSITGGIHSSLIGIPSPSLAEEAQRKPKKVLDGAGLFRRGKRKADKCLFLEAVALYNFALEKQREELGEDHIDCATTLNEIGDTWMMLGERYSALTAYEEALYIRQKVLGHGAQEVAETTNNIWMILHEQRCEMEEAMKEENEE